MKFTAVSGDVYEYEVEKVETLNPYAVDEMLSGDWDLTLFTCTYGGRKRVTVRCSLVGERTERWRKEASRQKSAATGCQVAVSAVAFLNRMF